jgi:hypothetical protein
MSEKEIVINTELEELFDQIKLQIWLNEEIQIQPKNQGKTSINSYIKRNNFKFIDL